MRCASIAVALALCALPAAAAADNVRVLAFGGAGFAADSSVESPVEGVTVPIELGSSFEFGVGIEDVRYDWIGIGGRLRLVSFATEPDLDRTWAVDLSIAPRLRAELGFVEIYAGPIVGLSIAIPPDVPGIELDLADGFHLDLVGGVQLLFPGFGIFVEGGFGLHSHSYAVAVDIPDLGFDEVPVDVDVTRVLLRGGALLRF